MIRHRIVLTCGDHTDHAAYIGFDKPLRTYFLQRFLAPCQVVYPVWIGTMFKEFAKLDALLEAANRKSYFVRNLPDSYVRDMLVEEKSSHQSSLAERLGLFIGQANLG